MERDPATPPAATSPVSQQLARFVLAAAVAAAALWVLRDFLAALAWATILAVALWPLYLPLLRLLPERSQRVIGPSLLTLATAIVVAVPLVLLGFALARESHYVVEFITMARHSGIAVPDWLPQMPLIGPSIAEWWRSNLSDPMMADALFGRISPSFLAQSARQYGGEVVHRLVIFFFTLLTLFFLFRDGRRLAEQLRELSDRLIGVRGESIARHMILAVHGTVTGLVLVGLAEGLVLGLVYVGVGLPYPGSLGAVTGVAAVIPFAAPIVFWLAGLYLFAAGNTVGAIIVIASGSVVVFIADHFIRPFLIGGAARLPFLWVLFGILGGLETFGILGLFLGPAIMAALVSLWREWTEPPPRAERARAAALRRPSGNRAGRPRKA